MATTCQGVRIWSDGEDADGWSVDAAEAALVKLQNEHKRRGIAFCEAHARHYQENNGCAECVYEELGIIPMGERQLTLFGSRGRR